MQFAFEDYSLPSAVQARISELAQHADCLLIGEIHGTLETPRIVAGLLPILWNHGYRGLGVEVPQLEQDSLRKWLSDPSASLPMFFARPWPDGRGSREMLGLLVRAFRFGFHVFCFDANLIRANLPWSARDAEMARHTHETWIREFPNEKAVALCGSNHAFLHLPPRFPPDYWPNFAVQLQQSSPGRVIQSFDLHPAQGEFFNMGLRRIDHWFGTLDPQPFSESRIAPSEFTAFTVEFPRSSAATFVSPPRYPSQMDRLRFVVRQVAEGIFHWFRR